MDRSFDAGATFGNPNPGPNPTAWGALENWSPDGVPTSEDSATFNNNFFQTLPNVHLDGVSRAADSLYLVFQSTQGEWRLGANTAGGTGTSATLTLTSGLISRSDSTNGSLQIIGATSGTGLLTGAIMTLETPAAGFTIDQGDADGEVQIEAILSGEGKTLTKNHGGLLTITRASTFTGATMINFTFDPTNTLNAAVDGALGGTASVAVDHSATLMLSNATASDRIKNDAPIRLGPPFYTGIPSTPPTIRRAGGGNEGLGNEVGLGALTLMAVNSILQYGGDAVANGTLTFADFAVGGDALLSIRGYDGVFETLTPGTDGTDDRLIFATSQAANLARFEFVNPSGMFGTFEAAQIALGSGFFEIVPAGSPINTFRVSEVRRKGNAFVIVFPALAGQRYRVMASADLADGFPIEIATIPASSTNVMREVTDSNAGNEPQRFYRVLEIGPTD